MVWNFITPKGPINYTPKDDVLQIWPLGGTHHSWPCHTWLSALCLHHHLLSTLGMQQEWFTLSMQRTPDRILNHEITLHPIAMQTVMQLPIGSCGHRYYEGKRIIFHEGEKKTQAFQSSLDILSDGTQKLPFIHFDEQMPFKKCLNFFQEEESTSYLLMDALFDELHQWYIFYWKIKN
jgi:hypothetical protein